MIELAQSSTLPTLKKERAIMRSRKLKNVSRVKRSPQSKHGKLDAKLAQYSEKYGAVGQPLCHKWLEASQSQPHAAITSQRPAMGWMSHRFAG
ncbi:hypothetical protein TWF173_004777 [Orbilia oligospora]|nr:hypothetical protein TWF173_004777 [Orbilia oligospora]